MLNTRDVTPLRSLCTAQTVDRFPTGTCVGTESIAAYFEEAFGARQWLRTRGRRG